mmetsp:Transcript_15379/g.36502  ORF Transcript_15379/g.36502 Transcript_15379/m.36502 type:complete len:263 (-) Transcript_15379:463-1251(-)
MLRILRLQSQQQGVSSRCRRLRPTPPVPGQAVWSRRRVVVLRPPLRTPLTSRTFRTRTTRPARSLCRGQRSRRWRSQTQARSRRVVSEAGCRRTSMRCGSAWWTTRAPKPTTQCASSTTRRNRHSKPGARTQISISFKACTRTTVHAEIKSKTLISCRGVGLGASLYPCFILLCREHAARTTKPHEVKVDPELKRGLDCEAEILPAFSCVQRTGGRNTCLCLPPTLLASCDKLHCGCPSHGPAQSTGAAQPACRRVSSPWSP